MKYAENDNILKIDWQQQILFEINEVIPVIKDIVLLLISFQLSSN